ncbi:MAG: sigma-70 family RNA polymerase sigma factor [Clostridia bacterium]
MDFEQLLVDIEKGDEDAKEQLYQYFKPIVRNICYGLFLLGGDKEDLLQEGMIALFDCIDNYDSSKGNFVNFARTCIRHRVLTAITQSNADKNKPLSLAVNIEQQSGISLVNPFDAIEDNDLATNIKQFIATKLSVLEQTVINYYLEGYSIDEICAFTDKTYKSVSTALQRARKKISIYKEK